MATLVELQQEFQGWRENLPENLQGSMLAEKLDAICDVDLSELEAIEVPLGFGRTERRCPCHASGRPCGP